MEYSRLNNKAKQSWFVARIITTIIISAILFGIKWFVVSEMKANWAIRYEKYFLITIGISVFLLLLNTFLYPFIEYKQWKYVITEDKVDFSEGIFGVTRTIVPIIRIQHIKLEQGPINRLFKLTNIEIVTAGGSHKIPNLEVETAEKISEYLKDKIRVKVEADE